MEKDTSIGVSSELADQLYDLKSRGETYEDIIWHALLKSEMITPDDLPGEHPESPDKDDEV